jgi:hypothetical protein
LGKFKVNPKGQTEEEGRDCDGTKSTLARTNGPERQLGECGGKGKWIRREELEDVHRGRIGRKCDEKRRGIGWDGMDPVKWTFPPPSLKRANCAKAMSESNQSKRRKGQALHRRGPMGIWPLRRRSGHAGKKQWKWKKVGLGMKEEMSTLWKFKLVVRQVRRIQLLDEVKAKCKTRKVTERIGQIICQGKMAAKWKSYFSSEVERF